MATSNSVKSALANPVIRTAVNKSRGANNNWYANRLSRLLEKHYGDAPVSGMSKLLSTNSPGSVSLVAPKGRPVGPVVVPTKMAHPEKVRLSIDTRHLYNEDNQNVKSVIRLFDQGNYYKNCVNPGLAGINEEAIIRVEGSEALYKESWLERFCGQTFYIAGAKVVLAESYRSADANLLGSMAQFAENIKVIYANERKNSTCTLNLDEIEDPYKTYSNIGFLELNEQEQIINRHVAWLVNMYNGQLLNLTLELVAIEFGN